MDRRSLLQGLFALPIVGAVDGYGYRHQAHSEDIGGAHGDAAATLKVVINGAFAIVVQANNRSRVRAFTPRDPDNMHKLYFLDGSEQWESKGGLDPREGNRRYNFELATDGLKTASRTPETDPRLASFNVSTDLWRQEDYLVTIDLPAPTRISALPPLVPVTFKNSAREACMAVSRVLEYDVTDLSKVKIAWEGGKDLRVTPCAALIKRYEDACRGSERGQEQATTSCRQRSKEVASYFSKSDVVFVFGTYPLDNNDLVHPVKFFNEQILASFPRVRNELELAGVHPREACRNQATSSHMKAPAAEQSAPRFTEVAYVPDCTIPGLTVSFPF